MTAVEWVDPRLLDLGQELHRELLRWRVSRDRLLAPEERAVTLRWLDALDSGIERQREFAGDLSYPGYRQLFHGALVKLGLRDH